MPVDDALGVVVAAVHGRAVAPDPVDLPALTLALLVMAAFAAGWVDAVVGGGGLIQLPALLIALPDSTPPADDPRHEQGQLRLGDGDQLGDLRDQDQARLADDHPAGRRLGLRIGARAPSWRASCPRPTSPRSC